MSREPIDLVALVAHARAVPSETRERFADDLASLPPDPSTILLRTCHRVELYGVGRAKPMPPTPAGGRRLEGRDALRHLLRVAAGLDSVVAGEDQVLHQLRACFAERHGSRAAFGSPSCLDPLLERAFQVALRVGRETRSWQEGRPRSLADLVVERAEAATGPIEGRPFLVVGAGRMGRLVALAAARHGARVVVTNRSHDRAAALASDAGGRAVVREPGAPLPGADAIAVALSSTLELGWVARRRLLATTAPILDLSSPPALEADLRAALGDRYVSIDDLARGDDGHVRDRLAARCERLLDDAEAEIIRWAAARATVPAIQALSDHAESRRAAEVERLFRRAELDQRTRALVEQMSQRLVASLLHAPLTTLRNDERGDLERAARELFSL